MKHWIVLLCILIVWAVPTLAQDSTTTVTADEVNAIAHQLYCPVCENITLDTCATAACADWRAEIRIFLEQGMSEQEIIDSFIQRFGDRVVGTPQDPILRGMSLITPWAIIAIALFVALRVFMNWQEKNQTIPQAVEVVAETTSAQDAYRQKLEQDLTG